MAGRWACEPFCGPRAGKCWKGLALVALTEDQPKLISSSERAKTNTGQYSQGKANAERRSFHNVPLPPGKGDKALVHRSRAEAG